jgi:hypothetical protein
LVVDPYSRAKEAEVALIVRHYFDIAVRHPKSFCKMSFAIA